MQGGGERGIATQKVGNLGGVMAAALLVGVDGVFKLEALSGEEELASGRGGKLGA